MTMLLQIMGVVSGPKNLWSQTSGNDDPKTPVTFGYDSGTSMGSVDSDVLSVYGAETDTLYALTMSTVTSSTTLRIDSTETITNDKWSCLHFGVTTLNRSDATYTNNTTYATWVWSSETSLPTSGTYNVTIR